MTYRYKTSSNFYWVRDNKIASEFPNINSALKDPDGLLAIGGDLSPERLLQAYRRGIFPWYSQGQPLLWWSHDPRWVLDPEQVKISRSLKKNLKKNKFTVTFNRAFEKVIQECAAPRKDLSGTWITREMQISYLKLFKQGFAHSVECWYQNKLVGGLYGVIIGKIFFGESMFSRMSDASKISLVHLSSILARWEFPLIDCQVHSSHLESLGAIPIPRNTFASLLNKYCNIKNRNSWPEITEDI